ICVTGIGASKEFSALMVNALPNLSLLDNSQCFPLYTYEKIEEDTQLSLFTTPETSYLKKENIPNGILTEFQRVYSDATITKEEIFYYVYGILHSPEYKSCFAADLKKMLPRIPYAKDFWAFSKAGRELAKWHVDYETVEPYPLREEQTSDLNPDSTEFYRVEKMRFAKVNKGEDKTTIIYNSNVRLTGIPLEA
ncbi:MAG: hypothetical protein NZL92_12365, partial [Gloeomargarita sp. SKYG116]|nr:hypothetical protein [Gloeomargarita sp. SKYG116]MDW8402473.1 type ISP restriction/modification enzyme [Gloeomargarita sp. SKYGB_i_bin116]